MLNSHQAVALAVLFAASSGPLAAQARERDQEREPRRRTIWVSRDGDRPRLGISTSSGSRRDTLGLLVTDVTEDGAAAKAGIEEGDRIASINGVNLRLTADDAADEAMAGVAQRRLIRELEKHKAGDDVELRVWSNGQWKTTKVKLAEPEDVMFGGKNVRALREEMENRAVLGLGLNASGSKRDTLGILVTSVSEDGPAEKAGIEEGDRIVSINGIDIRVAREDAGDWSSSSARIRRLNRQMERVKPGDAVELKVYRDGQQRTVRVTAGKASELRDRGGFFFGDGMGIAAPVLPRRLAVPIPPMAPGAPMMRWDDGTDVRIRVSPKIRAEFENGMRDFQRGMMELRRAFPRVQVEMDDDDGSDPASAVAPRAAPRPATGIAIAGLGGDVESHIGGFPDEGPAAGIWTASAGDEGTIYVSGLKLARVQGDLASYFGDGSDRGLLVLETSARWEGVREGDVILSIDGRSVRPDSDHVRFELRGAGSHEVELLRAGKRQTVRTPE